MGSRLLSGVSPTKCTQMTMVKCRLGVRLIKCKVGKNKSLFHDLHEWRLLNLVGTCIVSISY